MYWISFYDTYRHGLNATLGGDGTKKRDTKEIVTLWKQGHCVRDIAIILGIGSATVLNHLNMNPQEAGVRGPVYKTKNSIKYLGDFNTGRAKPISCYDMQTGKLVRSFTSAHQAMKFLGLKSSTSILRAAKEKLKSAHGYYWRQTENAVNSINIPEKTNITKIKESIVCVETNKMYESSKYAEKITGICYRSILFAVQGKQQTAGGFHWRYATNEDKATLALLKDDKAARPAHNRRSVKCVETGVIYPSLKNAATATNMSTSAVWLCCKNPQYAVKGYHFTYV